MLQTLSKAWGLAAARVGIAYANIQIISYLNKIKPPYNISTPNQVAALQALKNIARYKLQKSILLEQKELVVTELEKLDIVKNVYPSDANFVLIEVTAADTIYNSLVNNNIIIRNRDKVIKNCLRITIGTPQENTALIAALKNIKP
ncbi:MAG: aminotransferase class I/II-fold pyridoxal phosphate-dependent enzyme [Bacteroidota bacterium]